MGRFSHTFFLCSSRVIIERLRRIPYGRIRRGLFVSYELCPSCRKKCEWRQTEDGTTACYEQPFSATSRKYTRGGDPSHLALQLEQRKGSLCRPEPGAESAPPDRDLSICGVGFVLMWAERSEVRAYRCDPSDCFAIRSQDAGQPLMVAVQIFAEENSLTQGVLYTLQLLVLFIQAGSGVVMNAAEKISLGIISNVNKLLEYS